MVGELLGDGHARVLAELHARLDAIRGDDVSAARIIVLSGASGCGKSRIVRELYRRLQAGQRSPGYWPSLAESTEPGIGMAGVDPMPSRKTLGPPSVGFRWPPLALPSFAWWTFDCDRLENGSLLDALSQSRPAIDAHLLPMRLAWRDVSGWPAKLRKRKAAIIDRAREAAEEGALEVADKILGELAVPGLGLGINWLRQGAAAISRHRAELASLEADVEVMDAVGAKRLSAARELAELLKSVTHPHLPAIVVIEDLHLMTSELREFLEVVGQRTSGHPVLVVGTAWPEGFENKEFDQWMRWADIHGNAEVWTIPDLKNGDLLELIRWYAPKTDETDASSVIDRYRNPLALQLLCSLTETQELIRESRGRLELGNEDLQRLPYTLRGLYEARWAELPPDVRDALRVAANTVPVWSYSYRPDLVAAAARRCGLATDVHGLQRALNAATTKYSWTVAGGSSGQHRFRESVLAEIAREHLTGRQRGDLRAAIRDELNREIDRILKGSYVLDLSPETQALTMWLSYLVPTHSELSAAEATAVVASAHALGLANRPRAAAELLNFRNWQEGIPAGTDVILDTRYNFAQWCCECGEVETGLREFEALAAECSLSNANDEFGLGIQRRYLHWLGVSGKVDEAIAGLRRLASECERQVGTNHNVTLGVKLDLAYHLGERGNLAEAIRLSKEVVLERRRRRGFGPDDIDTLNASSVLARWLGYSGNTNEAVAMYAAVEAEYERLLGPDHRRSLSARAGRAYWLNQEGRHDESIDRLSELLRDRLRILGPDHPNTLSTRHNLGFALGSSGRIDEATEALVGLLEDRRRIFGFEDRESLKIRCNLAVLRGRAGHIVEAVKELGVVVSDFDRLVGADHFETLSARSNLSYFVFRSGQVELAIEQLEILVADQMRVLGPKHSATLTSQVVLADIRKR